MLGVVGFAWGVDCLGGVNGFVCGDRCRLADLGVPDDGVELRREGLARTVAKLGLPFSDATAAI